MLPNKTGVGRLQWSVSFDQKTHEFAPSVRKTVLVTIISKVLRTAWVSFPF